MMLLATTMALATALALMATATAPPRSQSRPATASAEVTACAQAQPTVDRLLTTADSRLEAARQTNDPAAMRAAVEALQGTLRDVRAQLAPCAAPANEADPHAGHQMPQKPAPTKKPPV